jgi:hypothetical protein
MWQALAAICDKRTGAARPAPAPIRQEEPWEIEIDVDL